MAHLVDHPLAVAWTAQCNEEDRPAARLLLRSLELISLADFEKGVVALVEGICSDASGRVGVFPVDPSLKLTLNYRRRAEAQIAKLQKRFSPQELLTHEEYQRLTVKVAIEKVRASSAGRIGHAMKMLERRMNGVMKLSPSETCLRTQRFKHIVLIDDFIGSGQAVTQFWNSWATKTIKSWLSYGYCRLWLTAYAAHDAGLSAVRERISYLNDASIRLHLQLCRRDIPEVITNLCTSYALKTKKVDAALGYGGILSPLVFQHGCPNNCPAILWDDTSKEWEALFPNRAIPLDLYNCFDEPNIALKRAEVLWNSGQYQLALALLDSLSSGTNDQDVTDAVTILGLLRRGVAKDNLAAVMTVSPARILTLLDSLEALGLTSQNESVTMSGKSIISRSRRGFARPVAADIAIAPSDAAYYPSQYRGVRR